MSEQPWAPQAAPADDAAGTAEAAETVVDDAATGLDRLEPVPGSGDPRVDAATARLAELAALPLAEQLPVYQDVHRRLHTVLADLDAG